MTGTGQAVTGGKRGWKEENGKVEEGRKGGEVLSDKVGIFDRLASLAQDDYGSTALTTGPRRIVRWLAGDHGECYHIR